MLVQQFGHKGTLADSKNSCGICLANTLESPPFMGKAFPRHRTGGLLANAAYGRNQGQHDPEPDLSLLEGFSALSPLTESKARSKFLLAHDLIGKAVSTYAGQRASAWRRAVSFCFSFFQLSCCVPPPSGSPHFSSETHLARRHHA